MSRLLRYGSGKFFRGYPEMGFLSTSGPCLSSPFMLVILLAKCGEEEPGITILEGPLTQTIFAIFNTVLLFSI